MFNVVAREFYKIPKLVLKLVIRVCQIVFQVLRMYFVNDEPAKTGAASSASSTGASQRTSNKSNNANHNQVIINVYDVTNGRMKKNTFGLLDGLWHTGLEVFGHEYFYCKHGILTCIPKEYEIAKYHHSIPMGESRMSEEQFKLYIEYFKATTYHGQHYSEIMHNCNNFTEEMTKLLVGRGIPDDSIWRL